MREAADALRLFVAIELPEEIRDALAETQARLKVGELERLRWAKPQNIHITLKFLGETPAGRQQAIEGALAEAVQGVAPFEIRLGKLGKFGGRQNPRVLWVDAAGDTQALSALQNRVQEKLSPLGFSPENRPFSVHLTLARVPEDMQRAVARPINEAIDTVKVPDMEIPVRKVSLMRSELRREGPTYTCLASFPLE
ncbi:MAG TPA: RNA 2',3'-cyclic phosphodiesterase [Dehalococcoidia bacterium]|nr:RNA 2',3'-cyclic phosphodiesterase [Dehalococcoidia bacterium]